VGGCQPESHSPPGRAAPGCAGSRPLLDWAIAPGSGLQAVESPGKVTRVSRIAAALFALSVTLLGPVAGSLAVTPADMIARGVESAFREAMELWAYKQFWRLWELSSSQRRYYMSQTEFADLMERGKARPAAGRRIEDLQVTATSPETAAVLARIGLEDPGTNTTRSLVRSFLFYYEDGRWRPQLSDFVGLSSYYFPLQPFVGPGVLFPPCCPIPVVPPKPPIVKPVSPCCFGRPPSPGIQRPMIPRR